MLIQKIQVTMGNSNTDMQLLISWNIFGKMKIKENNLVKFLKNILKISQVFAIF
jgi:hypothetical protein